MKERERDDGGPRDNSSRVPTAMATQMETACPQAVESRQGRVFPLRHEGVPSPNSRHEGVPAPKLGGSKSAMEISPLLDAAQRSGVARTQRSQERWRRPALRPLR